MIRLGFHNFIKSLLILSLKIIILKKIIIIELKETLNHKYSSQRDWRLIFLNLLNMLLPNSRFFFFYDSAQNKPSWKPGINLLSLIKGRYNGKQRAQWVVPTLIYIMCLP